MGEGGRIPWLGMEDGIVDLEPPRYQVYRLAGWTAERSVSPYWISGDVIEEIYVSHTGHPNKGRVTVYSGTVADPIGGGDEEMFAQGLWAHPDLGPSEVAITPGAWPEWKELSLTMHREPIDLIIDGQNVRCEGVISESQWFAQARFPDYQIRVTAYDVSPSDIELIPAKGVTSEVLTNKWGQRHSQMSLIE